MAAEPGPPPRLLYLVNSFDNGGAEWGLVTLLQEGAFAGFEVHVAALVRGAGAQIPALVAMGISPEVLTPARRMRLSDLLVAAWRFRALARRLRPRALMLSLPQANLVGRLLRPGRPRPLVLAFEHNSRLAKPLYTLGYRLSSRRVDWVLADCAATLHAASPRYPHSRPHEEVLPLAAVEPAAGPPEPRAAPPHHLVTAARLTPAKNQAVLIRAVHEMRRAGVPVRLTVYGEGGERGALQALVANLGLQEHVALPGRVTRWWAAEPADLFVMTSRHEGLCISALEAMAAGLPVAATPVGGLLDYGDKAMVLPLPADSAGGIAQALTALLADPRQRGEMSAAGLATTRDDYSRAAVRATYAAFNRRLRQAVES